MRYLILILLNIPVVLVAFVNIVTQYKLKKISLSRFRHQVILWTIIFIVVVGSFPLYNSLSGRTPFDSAALSLFDIVQTTVIIILLSIINNQRQRLDQTDKYLRDLHQELSIRLSQDESKKH